MTPDRAKPDPEPGERSTAFSETKPPQQVTMPPRTEGDADDREHRSPPTDGSEGESGSYADKQERKGT